MDTDNGFLYLGNWTGREDHGGGGGTGPYGIPPYWIPICIDGGDFGWATERGG